MYNKTLGLIATIFLALSITGCATQNNKDPLEGFNRGVYKFNDTADKAVIKPVAGAYKAVLPSPIRTGVGNFFSNLNTFVSAINNLLQGKINNATSEAGRFVINSTFGIAGLFDLASKDGIERHPEDFGQTLGYWGVGNGAYLVLPILGPSTVRDTSGLVVDTMAFDPISYVDNPRVRNSSRLLFLIDKRAQYLPASDLLDEAALDPYVFMRDAYLQRRANLVADGVVTKDDYEDDVPANSPPPLTK
ncbi:MAG: VacJ family lipoprotein [Methylophilaceae bacterium]|uniref:MlaA family lipoprotein n=1 Tax=Methylovorus sp. MM2 TaxID=1848038 RepID=UPI0007E04E83|nr:VacJ family lipoprotein [Methylovorus sp. MM2]OAM51463.1 ABC transporter [Methylovorus sp. MM2]